MKKAVVILIVMITLGGLLGILGVIKFLLSKAEPVPKNQEQATAPKSEEPKPTVNIENPPKNITPFALDDLDPTDGVYLYLSSKFKEASEVFSKEIDDPQKVQDKPRNLAYLANCYNALGQKDKADQTWKSIVDNFPQSVYAGESKFYFASEAEEAGHLNTAYSGYQEVVDKYPQSKASPKAALIMGKYYDKKGRESEELVWKMYSIALRGPISKEVRDFLRERLDKLIEDLVFSDRKIEKCTFYTVESRDNLTKIAKKFQTSPGFIMRINKKSDPLIRIGEVLKIIPGKVWIDVIKNDFFLTLFLEDGYYIKSYYVGLGKDDRTPVGTFTIVTKQENPPWYNNGKRIPAGDPRNVLGTRWMGFENRPGLQGFGIHGTTEPDSIGKYMSNGCVRMRNNEVEDLYVFIPYGTVVKIHPSN